MASCQDIDRLITPYLDDELSGQERRGDQPHQDALQHKHFEIALPPPARPGRPAHRDVAEILPLAPVAREDVKREPQPPDGDEERAEQLPGRQALRREQEVEPA